MDLKSLLQEALGADFSLPQATGIEIREVHDDSRQVTPRSLFVAVPGTKASGATFAADAAARGAAAIVTDTDLARGAPGPLVVRVPDARHAVARLAAVFHGLTRVQAARGLTMVGITGTNGKSTTAYMMRSLLRTAGKPAAMLGTIEYDLVGRRIQASLTTPGPVVLTKFLVEAHSGGARYGVMEVSSHSLDQRRTDGIRFSVAVFTNLTQDHLDYHHTRENYLRAKRRLFEGLADDAVAVVNADDPAAEEMVEGCRARVLRFGMNGPADIRAAIVEEGRSGCRFVLHHGAGEFEVFTPLAGRHNIANALAAAAAGLALGLEPPVVQEGLAALTQVPGRLQRIETGELGFDVFVDYAHTDDALKNVMRALRPLTRRRLWCVFGCGGDRDRGKRPLMAEAVAAGADAFVITSDNPRTEAPLAIIADIERGMTIADRERGWTVPDRAVAIRKAVDLLEEGDILVITGKGHEDYQIFGTEKVHFDDAEIARAAILRRQATVPCGS